MSDESSIDSDDFIWDDVESAGFNRLEQVADDQASSASSATRNLETDEKPDYERYLVNKLSQQAERQHSSHSSVDFSRFDGKHSRSTSMAHSRKPSNSLTLSNLRSLATAADDDDIDFELISALEKIADRTQSFKSSPSKLPTIVNDLNDGSLPAMQPINPSKASHPATKMTSQGSSDEPSSRSTLIARKASKSSAPTSQSGIDSSSSFVGILNGVREISHIGSASPGAEQTKPLHAKKHSDDMLVSDSVPIVQTKLSMRTTVSSKPNVSAKTNTDENNPPQVSSTSNPQGGIHSEMTDRKANISTMDEAPRKNPPFKVEQKKSDHDHSMTPAGLIPFVANPLGTKQGQVSLAAKTLSGSHLQTSEPAQARPSLSAPLLLDQIAGLAIDDILGDAESLEISSEKSSDRTKPGMSGDNIDQQQHASIVDIANIGIVMKDHVKQQQNTRLLHAPWLPEKAIPLQGRRPRSPSPCRSSSESHSCPSCVHKKFYDFPRKQLEMALVQAVRSGVDVDRLMQFMKEDPGTKQLDNLMAVIMKLKTRDSRKSRSRLETSRPTRTPRRKNLTQPGAVQ